MDSLYIFKDYYITSWGGGGGSTKMVGLEEMASCNLVKLRQGLLKERSSVRENRC